MDDVDMPEMAKSLKKIEDFLFFLVLDRKSNILEYTRSVLGRSTKRIEVFLTIDGKLSVGELADKLDMKRPNVSIELKNLLDSGLIEVDETVTESNIYRRKATLDMIGITSAITEYSAK
jgi:DNA-binding transcriptional ArsR family regulator